MKAASRQSGVVMKRSSMALRRPTMAHVRTRWVSEARAAHVWHQRLLAQIERLLAVNNVAIVTTALRVYAARESLVVSSSP